MSGATRQLKGPRLPGSTLAVRTFAKRGLILLICLGAFLAGLWVGKRSETKDSTQPGVAFYQDSMHPWVKSDRPGLCPICAMELTPILEGASPVSNSMAMVTLSREAVTVANVGTEPVLRRDITRGIRVSGVLEAQESRTATVAAPAGGRVELVAVDHPGLRIQQGETIVRIFSPDLAQRSRFLRIALSNEQATAASRVTSSQSQPAIAGSGDTSARTAPPVGGYRLDLFMSDLVAPISGIVSERSVTLGDYVMEGDRIATIIDPSVLWFTFDAADHQLSWILQGQEIRIQTESAPGKTWVGSIAFVEPIYDETRRSGRVRAAITNTPAHPDPDSRPALLPGMIAEGLITLVLPDVLAVPKSAVVYPGSSAWVYVEHESGTYERRIIRLGREADQWWEVLEGLSEGERVVTAGNVLLDAQATLEGAVPPSSPPAEHLPDPREAGVETHSPLSTDHTRIHGDHFREALSRFIAASDRVSSALANDRLDDYNRALPELPELMENLRQSGSSPRWIKLASRLTEAVPNQPARSLKEARAAFLAFGAAAAELAQHARSMDSAAGSFHIYHCPMAPKPGLWIQAGAPIANPFFGASMLRCGEKVSTGAAIGTREELGR